jgi:disulfide bond formation protein DsbB
MSPKKIAATLADARLVSIAIVAVSLASLAAALTAQYGFGMKPCTLCLYQRVPYVVTALLGSGALFFASVKRQPKRAAFLILICAVFFLLGSIVAFYHNGVERHWWESFLEGCHMDFNLNGGSQSLLQKLESLSAEPCDKVAWRDPVFHLSMAAWNLIASIFLMTGSLLSALLITRKANGF